MSDLASKRLLAEQVDNESHPSNTILDAKVARVKSFLHGVSLVLRHHSAPFEVVKDLIDQVTPYLTVSEEEKFLKRAKYLILWPMARYLINDEPPPADEPFHFTGRFWRWAKPRLRLFTKRNTHLWYSFLQAKRAAEPVSSEIVLSNFVKHRAQMQAPDPLREGCEDELYDEVMEHLSPILRKLRKILKQELEPFFERPQREIHKGSESASWESSRKTGGQAGHLRKLLGVKGLREKEQLFRSAVQHGFIKGTMGILFDPVEEIRARPGELQDLEEILEAEIQEFDSVRRLDAKVEAVLEPFKVRTISKGESLPYYLAKRFQLVLHGAMRKMDCFRLIGRPLDPPDLMDVVRHSEFYLNSQLENWLSIDYSAATDGLSASLSSGIMRELLGNLFLVNPHLYNMMLSVLAPHRVSYPTVDVDSTSLVFPDEGWIVGVGGAESLHLPDRLVVRPSWKVRMEAFAAKRPFTYQVTLHPVDQQNGQLMGSVLSFPILCLANLGLYLTVRGRLRPWAPLKNILGSVLVNGDDMLYIGSQAEWELHAILGKRIGLEMSVGKAYIHPRYANVNSTSVDLDLRRGKTPTEIKFLNVGLLVGRHKVLGKVGSDDEVTKSPVASVIDEVVRGSLPGRQADLFKLYCAIHKQELKKECRGRNLFIPKVLGGMGVQPILGIETSVSPSQLYVAEKLMIDGGLSPITRPMPEGHFVRRSLNRLADPIHLAQEGEEIEIKARTQLGPIQDAILYPYWDMYRKVERGHQNLQ